MSPTLPLVSGFHGNTDPDFVFLTLLGVRLGLHTVILGHLVFTTPFVVLIVAFGIFEWAVRTGRLRPRPWSFVFPLLVPSLLEQSLAWSARALARAEQVRDPVLLYFAAMYRATVATRAGDIEEVDRCYAIAGPLVRGGKREWGAATSPGGWWPSSPSTTPSTRWP